MEYRLEYAPDEIPTYLYRFDFDSAHFNHYRTKFCGTDPVRGVAHADDLGYLFSSRMAYVLDLNSDEYKTIRRMVSMWTSFAKTSNPHCEAIKPAVWVPVTKNDSYIALNISNDVRMIELPEKNKLQVWKTIYQHQKKSKI